MQRDALPASGCAPSEARNRGTGAKKKILALFRQTVGNPESGRKMRMALKTLPKVRLPDLICVKLQIEGKLFLCDIVFPVGF